MSAKTTGWLILLLGSILFAVLGVIIPNLFKQSAHPRSHNGAQLLTECLARHQLAYFTYFFALAIGADFGTNRPWVKNLLFPLLGFSFLFYAVGIFISVHQEKVIKRDHACANSECEVRLKNGTRWKLWGPNIAFAIMLFASAVILGFMVQEPGPTQ